MFSPWLVVKQAIGDSARVTARMAEEMSISPLYAHGVVLFSLVTKKRFSAYTRNSVPNSKITLVSYREVEEVALYFCTAEGLCAMSTKDTVT